MLQNIRDNSQGWIAKTIIGVIVALMALTGFDAIFQATSTSKDAAKVNGEEITQTELSQAVDMQRRQLMQQLGKDFDASLLDEKMLRESALKGLIDRKLLLHGKELAKLQRKLKDQGVTIVPIRSYFAKNGMVKVEVALAKGKKTFDKRESLKEKDIKRDLDRGR